VREILAAAPGVKIIDDMAANYFPMPKDASGQDAILVGRIRQDVSDPSGPPSPCSLREISCSRAQP
jgi:aspartate-semialdehyde dehydrogenase